MVVETVVVVVVVAVAGVTRVARGRSSDRIIFLEAANRTRNNTRRANTEFQLIQVRCL